MVEIMKSERNVGGGGGGGGAAGGGGPGGGGGVDPRSYESANSSHPLSSANPPNLPRPPIHPHPHSHTGPLLPPHTHAPAAVMTQQASFIFGHFFGGYIATAPHFVNVTDDHRYSRLRAYFCSVMVGTIFMVPFLEKRSF